MWQFWRPNRINQALAASFELVLRHGDRFYSEINIDDDVTFPYVKIKCEDLAGRSTSEDVDKSVVVRKVAKCTIVSVQNFPVGAASKKPFEKSLKCFRDCASGVPQTPIYDDDATLLGHVTASEYIGGYESFYTDEDTQETIGERGIIVEITYAV